MTFSQHIRAVMFLTLALMLGITGIVLVSNQGDPLAFALIGTRFSQGDPQGTVGYDGQFSYFIARDGANAVPYIDGPTLRYQRIVYPVLARAISLGQADLVPWALILINILAITIGTYLLAQLLTQAKRSPWYALLYPLWVGTLFSLRLDLNEPLCFTLGIASFYAYQRGNFRWVCLLLILSTLTKELGLLFAFSIALHAFFNKKRGWALLFALSPLSAFLAWWGILYLSFDTLPTIYPAARNIRWVPFNGLFAEENIVEFVLLSLWIGIPTIVMGLAALWNIYKTRKIHLYTAFVLMSAGFIMFMPDVSWEDQFAAYRIATPILLASILFLAQEHSRFLKFLIPLWLPTLFVAFIVPKLWI